jgi:hypothetical protein
MGSSRQIEYAHISTRAVKPSVVVDRNYVLIEGVRVDRPSRIAISQWLNYWGYSRP